MNINILRYSLFSIARDLEVDHTFVTGITIADVNDKHKQFVVLHV